MFFCTDRVTFDDMSVLPLSFVPYEFALHDLDGTPLLDVIALNTTESAIHIEFASMRSPTRSLTITQRGERDFLRPRERKSKRHRESKISDSSAISIDIDTYEDILHLTTIPSIPELRKQRGRQYLKHVAEKMKSDITEGPTVYLSRENGITSRAHERL